MTGPRYIEEDYSLNPDVSYPGIGNGRLRLQNYLPSLGGAPPMNGHLSTKDCPKPSIFSNLRICILEHDSNGTEKYVIEAIIFL